MKSKSKNPVLPLLLGLALLYFSCVHWQETARMLSVLFDSTPDYLWRYFKNLPQHFIYPAALFLGIVFLAAAIRRISGRRASAGAGPASAGRSSGKSAKKEHTHDRTDAVSYDPHESSDEHYIKQLDGFLASGIIDKAEYSQLIRRYRK